MIQEGDINPVLMLSFAFFGYFMVAVGVVKNGNIKVRTSNLAGLAEFKIDELNLDMLFIIV